MKLAKLQPTVSKLRQPMQEWKPWQRTAFSPKRLSGRALQTRNARIKLRDQYTCQCGCNRIGLPEELEVDHHIPLTQGGTDHDSNLRTLLIECHKRKTERENAVIAASR